MKPFDFSNLSPDQFAAYLAGFTDGEGYIGVEPTTRKNVSAVRIVLANCVPEILYGIQIRLGYGAIRSQQFKSNWRKRYTFSITNMNDCERFILLVLPYLTIKARPANDALARIEMAKSRSELLRKRNSEIKKLASEGMLRKQIASKFKVSPQTVSRICEGHKWQSERKRYASTRKRDERGLFMPITPVAPA